VSDRGTKVARPRTSRRTSLAARLAAIALACGLWAGSAAAEPSVPLKEATVKAAILLNLTKFVNWPDSVMTGDEDPIVLYIAGTDPVAEEISAQAEELGGRRKLIVVRGRDLARAREANVIYLAASERAGLDPLLRAVGRLPVLTVSDLPGFARQGGICAFRPKGENVGLEINLERARSVGLQISSKVLALSNIVSDQR
jgi:hypothetical protein